MKKIVGFALLIGVMILFVILSGCSSTSAIQRKVTITSKGIPTWIAGQGNAFQLEAQGGIPPYNWSVKPGSHLVNFISLSPNGIISGRPPTQPENSIFQETPPFIIIVSDSGNPPSYDEKTYTIIMKNPPTLTPTSTPFTFRPTTATPQPCPSGQVLGSDGKCHLACGNTYCKYEGETCVQANPPYCDCRTTACCAQKHPNAPYYWTSKGYCSNIPEPSSSSSGSSTSGSSCSGCSSDYAIKFVYSGNGVYHGSWASHPSDYSEICSQGNYQGSSTQTIPINCAKGVIEILQYSNGWVRVGGNVVYYPLTIQILKGGAVVYQWSSTSFADAPIITYKI